MKDSQRADHVKKQSGVLLLAAICFILGFALVLQIRSVYKSNNNVVNTDLSRAEDLQKQLSDANTKNSELSNKIDSLQKSLNSYKNAGSSDISSDISSQLNNAEILAGLTSVHGPGVVVTMKDSVSSASSASGKNANAFIIHDSDILQVLNELRDAGVEALSINDERILATSEVRCAGNTVSINNTRYSSPFVIKAIGDPDKLKSALLMKDGIVDELSQWGINVSVESNSSILVKAYSGTPSYKYAKSDQKGAK